MEITKQVVQAIQGDRDAFIQVIQQLENSLHRTAKSILRKDEDVADALQDTILQAYQSLHTLREPRYFKTWIIRILINECNKILAGRSRNIAVADIPTAATISPEYDHIDLREAIDRLDEQQRMVIILYYLEDMPVKQVAEVLELSESAVKMRLNRARSALLDNYTHGRKGR